MRSWKWLIPEAVSQFHREQLDEHGGGEGIRDPGRLEAALSQPQMIASYEEDADVSRLAASYAHGIAKGHPYVDGNKRTAWVAARTFLFINGYLLRVSQEEKYDRMYALAAGTLSENDFANWLRAHTAPKE